MWEMNLRRYDVVLEVGWMAQNQCDQMAKLFVPKIRTLRAFKIWGTWIAEWSSH